MCEIGVSEAMLFEKETKLGNRLRFTSCSSLFQGMTALTATVLFQPVQRTTAVCHHLQGMKAVWGTTVHRRAPASTRCAPITPPQRGCPPTQPQTMRYSRWSMVSPSQLYHKVRLKSVLRFLILKKKKREWQKQIQVSCPPSKD